MCFYSKCFLHKVEQSQAFDSLFYYLQLPFRLSYRLTDQSILFHSQLLYLLLYTLLAAINIQRNQHVKSRLRKQTITNTLTRNYRSLCGEKVIKAVYMMCKLVYQPNAPTHAQRYARAMYIHTYIHTHSPAINRKWRCAFPTLLSPTHTHTQHTQHTPQYSYTLYATLLYAQMPPMHA